MPITKPPSIESGVPRIRGDDPAKGIEKGVV